MKVMLQKCYGLLRSSAIGSLTVMVAFRHCQCSYCVKEKKVLGLFRLSNDHGKKAAPDDETRHDRSLTLVPPLPEGEEYGSSLREFHVKR